MLRTFLSTALRQCSREAKTHPHLIFLAQDQVTESCRGVAYSGHAAPGGRHEFIRELTAPNQVLAPEMAAIGRGLSTRFFKPKRWRWSSSRKASASAFCAPAGSPLTSPKASATDAVAQGLRRTTAALDRTARRTDRGTNLGRNSPLQLYTNTAPHSFEMQPDNLQ